MRYFKNPLLREIALLARRARATMSTAQQLIEAAYARSTANDAGKLASDGELLGHLNRKYQSLYAIMGMRSGDNAIAKVALNFAGGPPAFAALPADIIDLVRVEKNDGSRAYLIPANEKDRSWHLAPAMYRQGNSLVSRGQAGDPVAGDTYQLLHIDAPAGLNALATATDARFPVRFEDLLVLDLAVYLSVKDEGRNQSEYEALKQERDRALEMFVALTQHSNSAKERPLDSQKKS